MSRITSVEQLRRLYPPAHDRAVRKELGHLDRHHRRFIALSPFLAISSTGADGHADVSPRGETAGFVSVADDRTLLIPDRPGNNRLDTLSNIVANPAVGLMFLVPGVNEILRVNGRAELHDDSGLAEQFLIRGKAPKLVIKVAVAQAYLHCAKALMRSALWDAASRVDRRQLPTMGEMLADQCGEPAGPVETEAEMLARYEKALY